MNIEIIFIGLKNLEVKETEDKIRQVISCI